MTTILTVNAGSSSIRLTAFALDGGEPQPVAAYHGEHDWSEAQSVLREVQCGWTLRGFAAVSHRVVHGGEKLARSCLLTPEVEAEIARLAELAPLHNPAALAWVRACRAVLGEDLPQVAVFDTGFYAGLPAVAATYALPQALCRKHGIRRYGFHGLAHQAMLRQWRALRPDIAGGGRVVSLQLGAGCSITASRDGVPVDTSMGFSPLEGLVMATRAGDVDPGLLLFLQRAEGMTTDALDRLLNRDSGLLGLSAASADMRVLLKADDDASRLAVEVYCYRVRKYLGAYLAVLGGADGILFGGGVGEHAATVREKILAGMEWMDIVLDPERNRAATGAKACISGPDGRVAVWVVPVDEAAILAWEAVDLIAANPEKVGGFF